MDKQTRRDYLYMRMARTWAENSYCVRRKVGALLVKNQMIISDGYNGTPSGFENICEDENNVSKPYVLHAEANALTKVARSKRVVYGEEYRIMDGVELLKRAGIEVVFLNDQKSE